MTEYFCVQWTLPRVFFFFFQLLTGISQRKSTQTAGKKRPKISEVAMFESDF